MTTGRVGKSTTSVRSQAGPGKPWKSYDAGPAPCLPVFKWGYWFVTQGWFGIKEMSVCMWKWEHVKCLGEELAPFSSPRSAELEVWTGLRALWRGLVPVLCRLSRSMSGSTELERTLSVSVIQGGSRKLASWCGRPSPPPQPSPLVTLPLIEFLFFFLSFFFFF